MPLPGTFVKGKRPWGEDTKFDIALPCATQNEVEEEDAKVPLLTHPTQISTRAELLLLQVKCTGKGMLQLHIQSVCNLMALAQTKFLVQLENV